MRIKEMNWATKLRLVPRHLMQARGLSNPKPESAQAGLGEIALKKAPTLSGAQAANAVRQLGFASGLAL